MKGPPQLQSYGGSGSWKVERRWACCSTQAAMDSEQQWCKWNCVDVECGLLECSWQAANHMPEPCALCNGGGWRNHSTSVDWEML